jgi:hypothetical protein
MVKICQKLIEIQINFDRHDFLRIPIPHHLATSNAHKNPAIFTRLLSLSYGL